MKDKWRGLQRRVELIVAKAYREEVLRAQVKGVGEMNMLVTVCDEAFALHYIDKRMQKFHTEQEITVATDNVTGNKGKKRMKGKFTRGSVGHCEFGGWSEQGVKQYNELCTLARCDRQDPQAEKMETFLLNRLQVEKYGDKDPHKWMTTTTSVMMAWHRQLKRIVRSDENFLIGISMRALR